MIRRIGGLVRLSERPSDIVVASIHWGGNWGFAVPEEHVRFAHGLVRAGIDVVHGHSSHHVRPIEVFEGKRILYGCGDFLDGYEGVTGSAGGSALGWSWMAATASSSSRRSGSLPRSLASSHGPPSER